LDAQLSDDKLIDLIAEEVKSILREEDTSQKSNLQFPRIPLGISNRHIHLTQKTFHALFGDILSQLL